MRLIRHLVAKDVRRMALPVACWIALITAATLVVRCASLPVDVALGGGVSGWTGGLRLITDLLGMMGAIVTGVLTAFLVQEDPPTGTDAMWLTRPISRRRMLAAKAVAAALMLIAAPMALLGAIWISSGFSAGEWVRAAMEFAVGQGVIIAVTGSIAAITRDLGKFIFALIGLALVAGAIGAYQLNEWHDDGVVAEVIETRATLAFMWVLLVVLVVGAVQYLTRRTALAWSLLAGGLGLMLAIRAAWPWDTLAVFPSLSSRWEKAAGNGHDKAVIEQVTVVVGRGAPATAIFKIGALARKDEFATPWNGKGVMKWEGGSKMTAYFLQGGRWGESIVGHLLSPTPPEGPVAWEMNTKLVEPMDPVDLGPTAAMAGEIQFARMRARVVAELPWRGGAKATDGSVSTRIVSIRVAPNATRQTLVIEERDAWLSAISGSGMRSQMREMDGARRDCFAAVNRKLGIFQFLPITEGGTLKQNSLLLCERMLDYEPPVRMENGQAVIVPDWDRDTVLVKIRLEVIDRWLAPVAAERVAVVREEKKP